MSRRRAPVPLIYRIPLIGALAREWAEGDPDFPLVFAVTLILVWACAVAIWGLPALYLPAVAAVPVMFVFLILITLG